VARIDVPLLNNFKIRFFNQPIFDMPQICQFICRSENLRDLDQADIFCAENFVDIKVTPQIERVERSMLAMRISCNNSDWQLSSLAQACSSVLPSQPTLNRLLIYENSDSPPLWQDDMEDAQWLELLAPFTAVKQLYLRLSEGVEQRVASAMQKLTGEIAIECLPALRYLFLEWCAGQPPQRTPQITRSFFTQSLLNFVHYILYPLSTCP